MQAEELVAWAGGTWEQLTVDQRGRLLAAAGDIARRHPKPDDDHKREAALAATLDYLLGDLSLPEVGVRLLVARMAEDEAMAAARQLAVLACTDGGSEAGVARQLGIDRVTVRKDLGKR